MENENVNPLEIFELIWLKNKIDNEVNDKGLFDIIGNIENRLNFIKSTLYDNPFYLVSPGTFLKPEKWLEHFTEYGKPDLDEIKNLIKHGFVLIDRKLLFEKTLVDMFEPLNVSNNELLLDKDYGLILFPDSSKVKKNFYLGMSELQRYGEKYPILQSGLSNLFSIGAIRAHALLNNKLEYSPIEVEINSREELHYYIDFVKSKLSKLSNRYEVWFRGQTAEFKLDKIESSLLTYCPWRSVVDPSLIPSLFRKSELIQNDLKSYARKLYEILSYEIALNGHLDIPKYEIRKSDDEQIKNYFVGTVWEDSNSPFSVSVVSNLASQQEKHDYNPIYRGLQTSLFLQHYGIQTNILDITKDIDVALFFAQHSMKEGKYYKTENTNNSIIYLFLLNPETDRFIDSTELLESFNVQRPLRQKCGVLAGATYSNQNYYSKFISVKFKIKNSISINDSIHADYLFPSAKNDDILNFLTEYSKKTDMKFAKPF